jgi:threonine/homoserine/homoserine lactone efflux protein
LNVGTDSSASDSTSTLKIVLGAALLFGGLRRWRNRTPSGSEPTTPKWMANVETFTPVKAVELGALLGAVNPKNLALTLGTATGLAQLPGESNTEAVVGLIAFVVIASSTTAPRSATGCSGAMRRARTWRTPRCGSPSTTRPSWPCCSSSSASCCCPRAWGS